MKMKIMAMVLPFSNSLLLPCQYKIDHIYAPQEYKDEALHRILCKIDPDNFPSASQSRKAIEYGRLVVSRADDCSLSTSTSGGSSLDSIISNVGFVADSSTTLCDGDVIAIRSRLDNNFYPQTCTKYVDPPNLEVEDPVLFEDDHIAIVNKPEGIDCIGEKRSDLQSVLPFVLRPPSNMLSKNKSSSQCYLPRPVHRLDRKTSSPKCARKRGNRRR